MARLEITSIGAWKILEVTGWAHMIKAARTNGIDIEPGHFVTKIGETNGTPDVDLPGADEAILGCVINEPDGVLGTAFADNKAVNVAYLGSGCVVNTWAKANCGDLVENQKLYFDHASGFLAPWALTDAPASYGEATMQTELDKVDLESIAYVGRVYHDSADDASNDRVIKVVLV